MIVPPIKSQGIKTKLVPWIIDIIDKSGIDPIKSNWVEPFLVLALLDSILLYQESISLATQILISSIFIIK